MKHNKTPKGSEWRKWDLHIHTPCSILNNEFGPNWDDYVKNLFKKAIKEEIYTIGITDYFTIEGYKILQQNYLTNDNKLQELFEESEIEYIKNILVLPNIEFRINKLVVAQKNKGLQHDSRVNLHLILSNQIEIYQIEELLNSLEFEVISNQGEIEKHPLNSRNLASLGAKLRSQQQSFQDYTDIFVGMMNAAISEDDLIKILKTRNSIFGGKYLIGLPADEDLSSVSWNSQGHLIRKNLLHKSSFIFSSNQNTINFGLGKKHDTLKDFITEFGSLKPCIWGSDAHDYDKLFKPDLNRITWIKAANTFEGLKQILHEPEARVIIGQDPPDSKPYYQIIDKVRFIDNSGHKLFQPSWIEINDNLTVIIGGKSSGKSLLLYHIAATIDSKQVNEKNYFNENNYDSLKDKIDFEVQWKDNTSDLLSVPQKNGQLTYIPQLYINHLVEREGKGRLQELILDILLQNDELKEFFDNATIKKNEAKQSISTCVNNIFSLRDKYKEITDAIKNIGTKEQINIEIERLNKAIEALKVQSNFTDEQLKAYDVLSKKQEQNNANIVNQKISKEDLKQYINEVAKFNKVTLSSIQAAVRKIETSPISPKIESAKIKLENNITAAFKEFFREVHQIEKTIEEELIVFNTLKVNLENEIKPYTDKIKNQEQLKRETDNLKIQQDKLIELTQRENEATQIKNEGIQNNKDLFVAYNDLFKIYKQIIEKLNEPKHKMIGEELELRSNIVFDSEKFTNDFTELFDRRQNLKTVFNERFDEMDEFVFIEPQHVGNIQMIFDTLRKEQEPNFRLKTGKNINEPYLRLFDDYFKINNTIINKGDDILRMSPGKRGLVLLNLILHISTATHPILIDQPEDNLDNRTIYNELKEIMRKKKSQRQIILVTHNANLVVSTDAENIVVANQAGQQIGKDKREYQFEYISGPLENSYEDETASGILFKYGIREHVCEILEGGKEAFLQRESKYGFK